MLGCIAGVFVTVCTNSIATYHVAIVGFLSAGLVFTTSSVNSLIYYSDGAKEAGAAGFILMSMIAVCMAPQETARIERTDVFCRSFGSSTTARNRKPRTGGPSIHSRSTKTTFQAGGRAGT